jgi:hypothetical protein
MVYSKEIIEFIQSRDELNLEKKNSVAIVGVQDLSILELVKDASDNIFFISDDKTLTASVLKNFPNVKVIDANEENTKLEKKSIDYIFLDSSVNSFNINMIRKEFKRILKNCWDDVLIFESKEAKINEVVKLNLFAGSGCKIKGFEESKMIICYNPLGYDEEELKSKEIVEFYDACQKYCNVVENFKQYSVKKFLYEALKSLTNYYHKGFFLPSSSGSDFNNIDSHKIKSDYQNKSKHFLYKPSDLSKFLGEHDLYWSNFSPYPDDEDKEIFQSSLANDLDEIYDDLKSSLIVFNTKNIFNQQQVLWQWKFDWFGHTGDHITFVFKSIHWKLQELSYYDDDETNG